MTPLDILGLRPNQFVDGDITECEGIAISDIWGNYTGVPRDPDFSYAQYFNLTGLVPDTGGSVSREIAQGAVVYGTMPMADATFTALSNGELFVANPKNYSSQDYTDAQKNAPKGVKSLLSFGEIENWMINQHIGVALAMHWYENFLTIPTTGILPMPQGSYSNHCVAVYGFDQRGLLIKPWLGKDYGFQGYAWMSRDVFNVCWQEAYSFNPQSWRWLSLVKIALEHPNAISDILKILPSA